MTCKHENIITSFLSGGYSLGAEMCLDCKRRRSLYMGGGRAYASRRSKWYREEQKEQMGKKNLQWIFSEEINIQMEKIKQKPSNKIVK